MRASRIARLLPRFSSPSPQVIVTAIGRSQSRVRRTPPTNRAIRSKRGKPRSCPSSSDRKSTRLNSSHANISYAVFCLKKKKKNLSDQHQNHKQQQLSN